MTTFNYRYLDLEGALTYVGRKGFSVWYYRAGQKNPPPLCRRVEDRPKDAVAAVVAGIEEFGDGELLGKVVQDGSKDPIPPPPPPPPAWHGDLTDYRARVAADFFNGVPRTTTA